MNFAMMFYGGPQWMFWPETWFHAKGYPAHNYPYEI